VTTPLSMGHPLLVGGLVLSLVTNVILLARGGDDSHDPAPPALPAMALASAPDGPAEAGTPEPGTVPASSAAAAPASPRDTEARADRTEGADDTEGADGDDDGADGAPNRLSAPLTHSIPRTINAQVASNGPALSAEVTRVLMWDLDLRRDLRQGDELTVLWRGEAEDTVIDAVAYGSERHGRTIRAYRFRASGDRYDSYWDEDGSEIPRRLARSPLREYEEITSLLRDRPDHHGIDFKTPTGTPIHAPWAGRVVRTNWNERYNGGCIELAFDDGSVAKFLHLSEVSVRPGQRVAADEVIGLTGNTGRSTGPHLHYQLERGERILDPLDVHGTTRRSLPASDRAAFAAEVARLEALLAP
jgi:murein DD-endopeptidase